MMCCAIQWHVWPLLAGNSSSGGHEINSAVRSCRLQRAAWASSQHTRTSHYLSILFCMQVCDGCKVITYMVLGASNIAPPATVRLQLQFTAAPATQSAHTATRCGQLLADSLTYKP